MTVFVCYALMLKLKFGTLFKICTYALFWHHCDTVIKIPPHNLTKPNKTPGKKCRFRSVPLSVVSLMYILAAPPSTNQVTE